MSEHRPLCAQAVGLELSVVLGGLCLSTGAYYSRRPPLQGLAILVLCATAALLTLRLTDPVKGMRLARNQRWVRHWRRDLVLGVGLAAIGWLGYALWGLAVHGYRRQITFGGAWQLLVLIPAIAAAEELFFRGYMQNRLRSVAAIAVRTALVAAAIATYKVAIHLWTASSPWALAELAFITAVLSAFTSWFYERSGGLFGPIVLHIVWDLLVYGPSTELPHWLL